MDPRIEKLAGDIAHLEYLRDINVACNEAMVAARIAAGGKGNQWDSERHILEAGIRAGVEAAPEDHQEEIRETLELQAEVSPATPPKLPTHSTAIRRRQKRLARLIAKNPEDG